MTCSPNSLRIAGSKVKRDLSSAMSFQVYNIFCPQLRQGLQDAWRLFGTWSKNEVPTRARPLLPEQVLAMAGFALLDGDVAMAAALMVSFNGLLRPIEVMLQANQATFDFSKGTCHLDLGLTKSGKRAGIAEHVIIDDP